MKRMSCSRGMLDAGRAAMVAAERVGGFAAEAAQATRLQGDAALRNSAGRCNECKMKIQETTIAAEKQET